MKFDSSRTTHEPFLQVGRVAEAEGGDLDFDGVDFADRGVGERGVADAVFEGFAWGGDGDVDFEAGGSGVELNVGLRGGVEEAGGGGKNPDAGEGAAGVALGFMRTEDEGAQSEDCGGEEGEVAGIFVGGWCEGGLGQDEGGGHHEDENLRGVAADRGRI